MKIAIIGTRGIPNNYGGFEQLAQFLSVGLKKNGHELFVYCSNKHPFREKLWQGVNLLHQRDPEKTLGTIGQFIYDLNCILNSRKHNFDVVLNLGYTSSAVWMKLFSKRTKIITNMDGLEWKRTKFNKYVQHFLMFSERLAVKYSDLLVADSRGIESYLFKKYAVRSHFIAYGAQLFDKPDPLQISKFSVQPYQYNMLIARLEPENNIEMILDGVAAATSKKPFLIVGNPNNKFGSRLVNKYKLNEKIIFAGPIYDTLSVNNLRYFSNIYFHGHSVGGTNPSLLEAMGCHSFIAAHDNEFNRSVLGKDALYFNAATDVVNILDHELKINHSDFIVNNYTKIKEEYSWDKIISEYEKIMLSV
jgi:glycosyltransferase involved in cell wall biosynthesis